MRKKIVIMGAGGRDFHDFNVAFRDDPQSEVVAFTAAQIPGIDDRTYPASLAGPDGSEYGRPPPEQQMRPGARAGALIGVFSRLDALFRHNRPTGFLSGLTSVAVRGTATWIRPGPSNDVPTS